VTIFGDIMFFITSALVLSITCLVILLHVRARDNYTMEFLIVLVPLCLQMCLSLLVSYLHQVLPNELLCGRGYEIFSLWVTFASIILTTLLLFIMSRYLINLLPIETSQKILGNRIMLIIMAFYLFMSLFVIIGKSYGNWVLAMNLTFGYHFFSGSLLMIPLGIVSFVFRKKAIGREQEVLLMGMSATFFSLIITFPLDLLFFQHHSFKLSYLSFSIYIVFIYLFISRRYFEDFEVVVPSKLDFSKLVQEKGISAREEEIIELLIEGKTNREIASTLFISTNTVKTHIKNIYGKLEVSNRVQLYTTIKGD